MVVEIEKEFNAFAIMGSLKAHFPGENQKRFISFHSPPFLKEGQGGFLLFMIPETLMHGSNPPRSPFKKGGRRKDSAFILTS